MERHQYGGYMGWKRASSCAFCVDLSASQAYSQRFRGSSDLQPCGRNSWNRSEI